MTAADPTPSAMPPEPLRIGLVAGEASGDQLGAALIRELLRRAPQARCFGVGGSRMADCGLETWASSEELAVMGITEVLQHLPRLLRLRGSLERRFLAERADVFVGIDAPEFNLGLARRLKRRGIPTVQYVSPQVWAWRQGRVRSIGTACDRVLCLLPFETAFYRDHGVAAEFVGHPLADLIPLAPDRAAARAALGLALDARFIALLPGSRLGEVARLGRDFAGAAAWLAARHPDLAFLAPMASSAARELFATICREVAPAVRIRLIDGQSHRVLAACDAAIVASGTATLETLLSKRPMVVAYRLGAATAFLLRRFGLVKVPHFAQPNLLAGRKVVPEFFQHAVTPAALGAALEAQLGDPSAAASLQAEFLRIHLELKRDGAQRAADVILDAAARGRGSGREAARA
jgi:lipid-A-disaccharide synthase